MNFETKCLYFIAALKDIYRDSESKESMDIKLEINNDTLTEDFTAMLFAMFMFYTQITGDETDLVGFTHLLNRLAMQHVMRKENEDETSDDEQRQGVCEE